MDISYQLLLVLDGIGQPRFVLRSSKSHRPTCTPDRRTHQQAEERCCNNEDVHVAGDGAKSGGLSKCHQR